MVKTKETLTTGSCTSPHKVVHGLFEKAGIRHEGKSCKYPNVQEASS